MNSPIPSIQKVQEELEKLSLEKSFSQAQRVMFSVIALLDPTVADKDPESVFQLFTDSDGKIRANAGWFFEDKMIADRKAVYKIHGENALGIDFKAYGVSKASKRIVSWATGVTPNFEDEAFNGKFNVGIDFVVPKSCDRVIVVLTNNYVVRTLELKGKLTATYQEILAKWASINDFSNKKAFHSILWESFDLQPLNKKFYAGISERFILLRQHLEKEGIFDQKHASYFSNRLMGRVIFCWFLDHKNVLNAEKKYFDAKAYPSSTDYYRGRLETLFYRVLNTPVGDREPMVQDDVTPFLNGGLFEPRATDLFENPKLTFPKNYFDDLFEFLSGYNFTTDESTSQFQQVAIDPEMLGRIFENLLAEMTEETGEQARKAKGAFYTPREIVDYMCRESLREYLKTKIAEDEFRDQRLEQLIDRPDKEFQDQDHNWRRDWKPYKDVIIKALDELTVLDPACGSGAFPIGMLQLLVQVYERLESRFDSYRTKLQIIEKNLYGVDIEPMAVEIARLRAWLSIIVDEDADSKKIKPLPNLEFKFICANSLIDLDHNSETPLGGKDHNALAEELRTIRDAYFNTESLNKKKSLREKYNKLINEQEGLFGESKRSKQLKTYRPFDNEWSAGFFNPEFMFGVEKFDVVIGNPPYVSAINLKKNLGAQEYEHLKSFYASAKGAVDLYILFIERGFKLLCNGGFLNFITPNRYLSASYGKALREILAKEKTLLEIVDYSHVRVFQAAGTYPIISFFSNRKSEKEYSISIKKYNQETESYLSKSVFSSQLELVDGLLWGFLLNEKIDITTKVIRQSVPLSRAGKINATSTASEADDYHSIINDNQGIKLLNTGTIDKYVSLWGKKELTDKGRRLLTPYYDIEKNVIKENRLKLYKSSKIIFAKIAISTEAFYDEAGEYASVNTNCIHAFSADFDPKYVLSWVNSKLFQYCFECFFDGLRMSGGYLLYSAPNLLGMFIKAIPYNQQKEFANIVDQIISIKRVEIKSETKELERKIDHMFFNLYDLTDEEIKIIEKSDDDK